MEELLGKISELVERGLGIDFGTILIQLVAVLLLYLIVKHKFWKPVTELIEKRRAYIKEELERAETIKIEADNQKEAYELELMNAKKEASQIINRAKEDAILVSNDIKKKANEEIQYEKEKLSNEISLEKEKAKKDLQKETLDIAFTIAEKIVQKEIDKNDHKEVIDEFLKGVDQSDS